MADTRKRLVVRKEDDVKAPRGDDTTSTGHKPFRLLDLPIEIRNRIYAYMPSAVGLNDRNTRLRPSPLYTGGLDRYFPWLIANRQIYNETRCLVYEHFVCCLDLVLGIEVPSDKAEIDERDGYMRTMFRGCVRCEKIRCVGSFTDWLRCDRMTSILESITRLQACAIWCTAKLAQRAGLPAPTRKRFLQVHSDNIDPGDFDWWNLPKCFKIARKYADSTQLQIDFTYYQCTPNFWDQLTPDDVLAKMDEFVKDMGALDVAVIQIPDPSLI